MYRKVAHTMHVLVCGGDGTVGWVFSTLDDVRHSLHYSTDTFSHLSILNVLTCYLNADHEERNIVKNRKKFHLLFFHNIFEFSIFRFQLKWPVYPPVAVLPLGTGNDLARYVP